MIYVSQNLTHSHSLTPQHLLHSALHTHPAPAWPLNWNPGGLAMCVSCVCVIRSGGACRVTSRPHIYSCYARVHDVHMYPLPYLVKPYRYSHHTSHGTEITERSTHRAVHSCRVPTPTGEISDQGFKRADPKTVLKDLSDAGLLFVRFQFLNFAHIFFCGHIAKCSLL